MSKKIIASQMPFDIKISKTHHLIWNDGSLDALTAQVELLARYLHDETVENPPETSAVAQPLLLNDLHRLSLELAARGAKLGMRVRVESSRHHMVLDQARFHLSQGGEVLATGFLELTADHGVLRWPAFSLKPGPDDVHVPSALLRPFDLRPGLMLRCALRLPQERERGLVAESILEIEGVPAPHWETPPDFDKLTPLFPNRRIFLEAAQDPSISARAVDLIAPLGMGQRGLIVAPPRAGKTLILKALATAIRVNHPDIVLMLLLVDERPEEVTDLRRDLDCEIYSSTFDEQVTAARASLRGRRGTRQTPRGTQKRCRDPARFDHPHVARLQQSPTK